MFIRRAFAALIALGCFVGALHSPIALGAETLAQAECPGNALVNPGFEEGFSDRGAGEVSVANGWFPWWQDGPRTEEGYNRRPEYKPEDASRYGRLRVRTGNFAQKFFNTFSTHNAGLFQQVQVQAGSQLTFSAWVQTWSSTYHDPTTVVDPGNYRVYVGIDPTGSTDWRSPNVVWSEPRMDYNTWMRLEVRSQAQAGTITVFLRGQPEFRTQFNDSYWDDACLTVVRPTPRPSNTPTDTPTPTASPTPTVTPTPLPASVCVLVFQDSNANSLQDAGEPLVSGAGVWLLDASQAEIGSYSTVGTGEPHCFSGLAAGAYYVRRQNPPAYTSTNEDELQVVVEPGETVQVAFGAQFVPTPTPTSTATPTVTPTPTATPKPVMQQMGERVHSVSGILVVGLALLIAVGVPYLRKRL